MLLSPTKYFNQRLLNYTQKFPSECRLYFCAYSLTQKINLQNQINVAMRKIASSKLTAGMLINKFNKNNKHFTASDQAFTFMKSIKETPTFWKKFWYHTLAMVMHLGVPLIFITLASADLKWNVLIPIISKLN